MERCGTTGFVAAGVRGTMRIEQRIGGPLRLALALLLAWAGLIATMSVVPPGPPRVAGAAPPPLTTVPADFQDTIAFSGLDLPTSVHFAADGRVFVTEKKGVIKVFADTYAASPMLTIDLQTNVNSYFDHGLSGLALDPQFPTVPDIYIAYTYDAPIGGTAPVWNDQCQADAQVGCVTSGRVSHIRLTSPTTAGPEQVLVEDWCQQFVTHSIDDLAFGPDGKLYVSAGEGANHTALDIGQFGAPPNPCGDPNKEGGSLRAQDVRTAGDPLGYGGTILRVDPANPADRQIVGYGLRNPYRIAFRPGTNNLWIADVGSGRWEELNWIPDALAGAQPNFGWPCYEGFGREIGFDSLDVPLCESLYGDPGGGYTPGAITPYFSYEHNQIVSPNDGCRMDPSPPAYATSAITGVAFYGAGNYPAQYHGALFFADFARGCIWTMAKDGFGNPDPFTISPFVVGGIYPVHLQIGPDGDLYYVDIFNGTIHRVRYRAPVANIQASATSGASPLVVDFDGGGSTTPSGTTLAYSWDLDGDGTFGDATTATAQRTYPTGNYTVRLRVTASNNVTDYATVQISAGNTPPTASLAAPSGDLAWRVGDQIAFNGSGTDPQQGILPASAFTWTVILHHCPSGGCHQHILQTFTGVKSGTFTTPDHEYPSYLEVRLTVRDAGNLTDMQSVVIYPRTVTLSFATTPPGGTIYLTGVGGTTPFSSTVIAGSANTVSALPPDGQLFTGWTINGQPSGWASPLTFASIEDATVVGQFAPPPIYSDVPPGSAAYEATRQLGARGLVRGYTDGRFGPDDQLLRAQIAVLLVRAMGWSGEQHPNPFTDDNGLTGELWSAVATLASRNIARGYTDTTYGPNDWVLYAQAVSLITRTMVAQGYWQYQPDDPNLYPAVPASAGHRVDLATFVHYTGALPDVPADQPFATWNQPANRGWFARALWQALDSYFGE